MTYALIVASGAAMLVTAWLFYRAVGRATMDEPRAPGWVLELAVLLAMTGLWLAMMFGSVKKLSDGCIYRDVSVTEAGIVYTGSTHVCPVKGE